MRLDVRSIVLIPHKITGTIVNVVGIATVDCTCARDWCKTPPVND